MLSRGPLGSSDNSVARASSTSPIPLSASIAAARGNPYTLHSLNMARVSTAAGVCSGSGVSSMRAQASSPPVSSSFTTRLSIPLIRTHPYRRHFSSSGPQDLSRPQDRQDRPRRSPVSARSCAVQSAPSRTRVHYSRACVVVGGGGIAGGAPPRRRAAAGASRSRRPAARAAWA